MQFWQKKISRYYHTIKYLKTIQNYSRVKLILVKRLYRNFPKFTKYYFLDSISQQIPLRGSCFFPSIKKEIFQGLECKEILSKADIIAKGEFTFLNEKVTFSSPYEIRWNCSSLSQLWRYNLHYFDYIWDLGVASLITSDEKYYNSYKLLVTSWIKQNMIGIGDGWHPYTVSLKIVNWIYSYYIFESFLNKDLEFKNELMKYIYCMAKYLKYNLEYHVLGNHLLENGRALLFAGLFFGDKLSNDWLEKGREILWNQAEEQVLTDGGHFELSPMYHSIVLWIYLECTNLLKMNNQKIPDEILIKIEKMLVFQKVILHPDGKNPLFNDSAFAIGPDPLEVLNFGSIIMQKDFGFTGNYSCKLKLLVGTKNENVYLSVLNDDKPTVLLEDSGYYLIKNNKLNSFLVIDCGKPCPDYLPAHAHADLLSYELSLNNERFIVDSGVYQYKQGKYRDYFRSTKAHNTVEINGQNQSDVWGSFRVGRRGNPLEAKILQYNQTKTFKGSHDSYYSRYGIIHTRYLSEIDNRFWIILDEMDFSPKKTKEIRSSSYIHFHPNVLLDKVQKDIIALKLNNQSVQILPFGLNKIELDVFTSKEPLFSYSPEFGKFETKLTMKVTTYHNQSFVFGYIISPVSEQYRLQKAELIYNGLGEYLLKIYLTDYIWQYKKNSEGIQILKSSRGLIQ